MWPLFVVLQYPESGENAYLVDGIEQVSVQNLFPISSVEALDKSVLVGLTGLDVAASGTTR